MGKRKLILSARQSQHLDRTAIERYGVPAIVLMENAGSRVAREVLEQLRGKRHPAVCVFCGIGNNAGDGFVVARHLHNAGVRMNIFFFGQEKNLKPEAATNYRILNKMGSRSVGMITASALDRGLAETTQKALARSDIVVDAIFGLGLNRVIEGVYKEAITLINEKAKKIIAVDIPSGLDATTGKIYGVCIKAFMTVTFNTAKTGFYKNSGPAHTGKIVIVDIGVPEKLLGAYRR